MPNKVLAVLLLVSSPLCAGPIIDCKFKARNAAGDVKLSELAQFDINPEWEEVVDFSPYEATLSANFSELIIKVSLSGASLSQLRIPLDNVAFLPCGVPIFGQVRVAHTATTEGYTSLRYECIKVL